MSTTDQPSWHDTYQEHASAVDAFFAEILASLPDVPDMSDAYDGIPRGIAKLKAEVERAEATLARIREWTQGNPHCGVAVADILAILDEREAAR